MSIFDRNMRRLRVDPEPWASSGGGTTVKVEGASTVGDVNLTGNATGLPAGAVAVFFRQSGASPTLVGGHVAPFSGATGIAAGAPGAVPAPSAGQQDNLLSGAGTFSVVTTSAGRSLLSAADAAAQRAFLGLGTAAVHPASDFVSAGAVTTSGLTASATDVVVGRASAGGGALEEIPCTAAGRAILDDVDAAAQRTTLGLGTAATHAATDFALASHTHDAADIVSGVLAIARLAGGTPTGKKFVRDDSTLQQVQYSDLANVATDKVLGRATAGTGAVELVDCTAAGRALIDDADATAQRATLGLGTAATHPATDFASSGLATASGLTTSATDVVLGRSSAGGGALQEVPCTATGRSIIAGASVAAVRTTLGLGSLATQNTCIQVGANPVASANAKFTNAPSGTLPDGTVLATPVLDTGFTPNEIYWTLPVGTTIGTICAGDDSRILASLTHMTHPQVLARTLGG